jgi:hypothetical protein
LSSLRVFEIVGALQSVSMFSDYCKMIGREDIYLGEMLPLLHEDSGYMVVVQIMLMFFLLSPY